MNRSNTGLDSYSALNVIKSLQVLANGSKQSSPNRSTVTTESDQKCLLDSIEMSIVDSNRLVSNIAIMCSIHQPTSEVFECFSHIILMQSGRITFQGTVDEAKSFFSRYESTNELGSGMTGFLFVSNLFEIGVDFNVL